MKAADTDRSPGEPILLSQATLEQVLDAFLPEDPADATAAARIAARNAEGIEGLFGSETLDEVRDDLVIRPAPESPPWRTYFPREETESHGATEAMTSPATSGARRHIRWWPVAAAVAIGFAVGSLAIPPLFDRGPEVRPPSSVPAAGASETASATAGWPDIPR